MELSFLSKCGIVGSNMAGIASYVLNAVTTV